MLRSRIGADRVPVENLGKPHGRAARRLHRGERLPGCTRQHIALLRQALSEVRHCMAARLVGWLALRP